MRLLAPDARASRGSWGVSQNILSCESGISRVLQVTGISNQTIIVLSNACLFGADTMLFCQITHKIGNYWYDMSVDGIILWLLV